MSQHRLRTNLSLAVLIVAAVATLQAQGRRQPGQGPQTVPVTASLKIGTASYVSNAAGSCTHAPRASIYGVLSEMWSVRQHDEDRSVQLTMWRSKDGGDETFNLSVNGTRRVQVSTVKGGQPSGSGTIKLQPSGKGGTFTVDAKTSTGQTVTGTIACPSFAPATAEGG